MSSSTPSATSHVHASGINPTLLSSRHSNEELAYPNYLKSTCSMSRTTNSSHSPREAGYVPISSASSIASCSTTSTAMKREIFPQKLLQILNDESLSEIITWLPHGRSFVIIRPDVFTDKVLPKYLPPADPRNPTKYPSFTRKLNRWGFKQATRGPDTGAFNHPLFCRDQPDLCLGMVCQRSRDRTKTSSSSASSSGAASSSAGGASSRSTSSSSHHHRHHHRSHKSKEHRSSPSSTSSSRRMDNEDMKPPPNMPRLTKTTLDSLAVISHSSHSGVLPPHAAVASSARGTTTTTTADRTTRTTSPIAAVSVSEGSQSEFNFDHNTSGGAIVSDRNLVHASLQQSDDLERVRVAKTLLYQAFIDALQTEGHLSR